MDMSAAPCVLPGLQQPLQLAASMIRNICYWISLQAIMMKMPLVNHCYGDHALIGL